MVHDDTRYELTENERRKIGDAMKAGKQTVVVRNITCWLERRDDEEDSGMDFSKNIPVSD